MRPWHALIGKHRLIAYLTAEAERYAAERRQARQLGDVFAGDRLLGAERAMRTLRMELR